MLEHGIPFALNDRVRRLVAPNPGITTGVGTNTYLLGRDQVAVLDPGPDIPEHIEAIIEAGAGRIRWIACTHTHPDHSPAWRAVAEATGAEVLGSLPADDRFQDETFVPTRVLQDGDCLEASEFTLRALHTPGHVSNHFCFLLEEEGMLFAGDHIMQGSTVVIVPPGGDMQAYIASLRLLLDYPLCSIAPGHGEVIAEPLDEISRLVEHRLARERKVHAGLERLGRSAVGELVEVVYDDVHVSRHAWARLSLTAHLVKLQREQQVVLHADDTWELKPQGGGQ